MKVLALAALFISTLAQEDLRQGDGTVHALDHISNGNCNFMVDVVGPNYAAISSALWNDARACGQCAEVWCIDDQCQSSESTTVFIVDRCPECQEGDLDLSPTAFQTITGSHPSRLRIEWQFVDCPVEDAIDFCLKPGSNSYWYAVQPMPARKAVNNLVINGFSSSSLSDAYYFVANQEGQEIPLDNVRIEVTLDDGSYHEHWLSLEPGSCTYWSSFAEASSFNKTK